MKYLLTSSGVGNPSLQTALADLLGKPFSECAALCIPTAAYYFAEGPTIAYRLITGELCNLGWKSMGVLELTALAGGDPANWSPRAAETDIFLVGGGDPMYLCHWMRESGFAELLPTLRADTVYVGISAGSMAVTASFGDHYNDRPVPRTGSETPLGLVDIAIYPHLDHSDMEDTRTDNIATWATRVPVPTYGLDDDSAIMVTEEGLAVVSEGHWERFEPVGP